MASPADQKRIDAFVARLADRPEKSQRMIALSELSRIHRRHHEDGTPFAPTTNRRLISDYRTKIKEVLGEDAPVLNTFRYSPQRVEVYNQHRRDARDEKFENQRPVDSYIHIHRATATLDWVKIMTHRWTRTKRSQGLSSSTVAAAIVAVVALTGRRTYEVACTGTMEPVAGDDHLVTFGGQTKTRDAERAEQTYTFPVLDRRDLVLETVAWLRTVIDPTMPNRQFSQRWSKDLGTQSKTIFQDSNDEPIVPRELREAYAAIAYDRFATKKTAAVKYYNQVLGHKEQDYETSLFYFAFHLQDRPDDAPVNAPIQVMDPDGADVIRLNSRRSDRDGEK